MANPTARSAYNVPGRFYVDTSCIDCAQCRLIAPELFERDPDTGLGYLKRQPSSPDEVLLAEEALSTCATQSIGNDGE